AAGEGPARNAGRFGSGLLGARLWRGRVSEQIAEREIALFLLPRAMGERKVERFASVDGEGEANDRRSEWIVGLWRAPFRGRFDIDRDVRGAPGAIDGSANACRRVDGRVAHRSWRRFGCGWRIGRR